MNTAMRVAVTSALRVMPDGHSQESSGVSDPAVALPPYTLMRAMAEKMTRTMTSMPSSAYCRRAETSMPR